jgi:hypothetical protein
VKRTGYGHLYGHQPKGPPDGSPGFLRLVQVASRKWIGI